MSDPVLSALILGVQGVLVALIARLSIRVTTVKKDAAVTREQVANDHTTNLREENDSRHAETRGWFGRLERSVGGIRDDARTDRERVDHLAERVDHLYELETTRPRKAKPHE